jgi:hypothetical protein
MQGTSKVASAGNHKMVIILSIDDRLCVSKVPFGLHTIIWNEWIAEQREDLWNGGIERTDQSNHLKD